MVEYTLQVNTFEDRICLREVTWGLELYKSYLRLTVPIRVRN